MKFSALATLLAMTLAGGGLAGPARAAETTNRPNVLLIILEDWGPYLGCYGQSEMFTPNLDRLAAEGCR